MEYSVIDTIAATAAAADATPAESRQVFRVPLAARLLSPVGVILLILVTVLMIALAAFAFTTQWPLGLFIMACAGFMGALTGYVWRDLQGKWGLRAVLDTNAVTLDLPASRSLIHRPPAQSIPYSDIAGIDARFEAYGSLGMEMIQRAYVLHRKGDEPIFLFEERALATAIASLMFAEIVAELAARAGVTLRELGTVEGKGGRLGVWGTHAPDWAAPALPRERAMRLWGHAAATGSAVISMTILVSLLMQYFRKG